jgi:hypothetical protein
MRQLKNRESAERSRLKKDNLVDSLTCQVCDFYVQLSDLMSENVWLKSLSDDSSSVFTSCDNSECSSSSSSCDESAYSPVSSGCCSPYYAPSSSAAAAVSAMSPLSSDSDDSEGFSPMALRKVRSCSFDSHCSTLSGDSTTVASDMSPVVFSSEDCVVDSGGDWWMDEGFDLLLDSFNGNELFM